MMFFKLSVSSITFATIAGAVNIKNIRCPDGNFASDEARTACEWQSLIDNQDKMVVKFKAAVSKLAVIGHNPNNLVDCSDVVPEANVPLEKKHAT
ncbi:GP1_2 [Sanghuangporus sanghuang]